uniref:Uncharacterized protein n=1 Tax=Anguilla anguilla TaxID=7936 RepID=A0A0E9X3G6_ANGAN
MAKKGHIPRSPGHEDTNPVHTDFSCYVEAVVFMMLIESTLTPDLYTLLPCSLDTVKQKTDYRRPLYFWVMVTNVLLGFSVYAFSCSLWIVAGFHICRFQKRQMYIST